MMEVTGVGNNWSCKISKAPVKS